MRRAHPGTEEQEDEQLSATLSAGSWIGTSGWSYDHWTGVLYPPGLPTRARLAAYVRSFDTVELNASFYRWPPERTFASWHQRLPPGFRMTVKAPRGLTHARRLYQPEEWIERIRVGLHALGDRRGVLLVQSHPAHERDDARLDFFLGRLRDACPWLGVAVELRHPSWHCDPIMHLLRRHGAAYVVMSGPNLTCRLEATAPFVYVTGTGRAPPTCMPGPTPTTTCSGGPNASESGAGRVWRCSATSTTTVMGVPCATPSGCGNFLS